MSAMLVLRRGGLGDTLLLLPVLRALRRAHPDAEVHFAGVTDFAEVLRIHGAVDVVHSSESFQTWRLAMPDGGDARDRLLRFALVVADAPEAAVVAGAGTEVRGLDLVPRRAEPFARQLVRQLGLAADWPADARLAPARSQNDGAVLVAPGSGGVAKNWPRDRWLDLATWLAARGIDVEVLVGPAEVERDDPRRWPWPAAVTFVVEATVVSLAQRLGTARSFVGNDSGTTHLAAMLSVPTVALFGPTDPAVWAPPLPEVAVVRSSTGAMDGITVDAVAAALARSL